MSELPMSSDASLIPDNSKNKSKMRDSLNADIEKWLEQGNSIKKEETVTKHTTLPTSAAFINRSPQTQRKLPKDTDIQEHKLGPHTLRSVTDKEGQIWFMIIDIAVYLQRRSKSLGDLIKKENKKLKKIRINSVKRDISCIKPALMVETLSTTKSKLKNSERVPSLIEFLSKF